MTLSALSSSSVDGSGGIAPTFYSAVATIIFVVVSFTFFFPCNWLIPLDRRACAVVGATLCYMSRVVFFPDQRMDLVEAVDFDVLVLLAGIMAVNFIVVHQSETKAFIGRVQSLIQTNPRKGFWATSVCVFLVSPFLTNDGVCLLFVEPILSAFEAVSVPADPAASAPPLLDAKAAAGAKAPHSGSPPALSSEARATEADEEGEGKGSGAGAGAGIKLQKSDAFYFLITLACSSNIGSALTYTGNPQVHIRHNLLCVATRDAAVLLSI
jgi:Na+/H+ antiporter NhaD/arsenite permease-like protein